jgi:DNA-binding FadR family transcriptional regulator
VVVAARLTAGYCAPWPNPDVLSTDRAKLLAKAIADGKYEVGQRLPSERELAQTF